MVVIADDSGSMNYAAEPLNMRRLGQVAKSRGVELCQTVSQIVEIASCFDDSGVDVFFLNRQPVLGVREASDPNFRAAFESAPAGSTPLTEVLQRVAKKCGEEQNTLLFILTDGLPNGGMNPFVKAVEDIIQGNRVKIQIMACTAETSEIGWLNELDQNFR